MPVVNYKNPDLERVTGLTILPQWDEKMLLKFKVPRDKMGNQSMNPNLASEPFPYRQRRLGNLTVDDSMVIIKEAMKDNQGYFIQDPNGNRFRACFPYARYIKKGDKINNLTTGDIYTIVKIYDTITNDVLLDGKKPPRTSDRLRLDEANEIFLNHAFPRLLSKGHKFSEEGSVADKPAPWNDTITYIVTRSEPGSVSDNLPFQGTRQMKPQFRESVQDPVDPVLSIESDGWFFDNLVQFDCWAQTNARAVSLLQWLEDFMFRNTWLFELYGVAKVLYWRRDEDKEVPVWRNDITKRCVIFYFRTERVFSFKTRKLSHINVTTSIDFDENTVPVEYTEIIPPGSSSDVWPEPTSSIDVILNQSSP